MGNMRIEMNFVLLCAVALFAAVHTQEPSPDELKKYSPCYTYVLCKDPAELKKFKGCLSSLNEQEFQEYYEYLKKNFVSFKSDSLSGAISEYCSSSNAKEQSIFNRTVNADYSFQKKTGDQSIESGLEQATGCVYKILKELYSEGKCSTV